MSEHFWQVRLRYEQENFARYHTQGRIEWEDADEMTMGVIARTIEEAIAAAVEKKTGTGATVRNVHATECRWQGEVHVNAAEYRREPQP